MPSNKLEFKFVCLHYEVICNGVNLGDIYTEVDGYYVWTPMMRGGFLEAWVMRGIADKLDELNKDWDQQVKAELQKPSTDISG